MKTLALNVVAGRKAANLRETESNLQQNCKFSAKNLAESKKSTMFAVLNTKRISLPMGVRSDARNIRAFFVPLHIQPCGCHIQQLRYPLGRSSWCLATGYGSRFYFA